MKKSSIREGYKRLTVDIEKDVFNEFKKLSVDKEKDMRVLVQELIVNFVRREAKVIA